MNYIFNIYLVINIMFFLIEFLHIFNKIVLVLIFVAFFSFYFLFYFLSFTFNTLYSNYIYTFYFKYNSIFFLLKYNVKSLFNITKFNINHNCFLLICNKYANYMEYLNSNIFLSLLKTKFLLNVLNLKLDLKYSINLFNNFNKLFFNTKFIFFL